MQFIVSGDQHIKISKELPLEWQLNRFRMLWQTYIDLCHEHKAELVLTGDLFHNAKPNLHETMLALELFQLLEVNEVTARIIAGNHENLGAAGTTLDYFQAVTDSSTHLQHCASIIREVAEGCELVFVGHDQLQRWLEVGSTTACEGTRVVFSHFRPTVNQFIQEEIDVEKFCNTADFIFAGDIHMEFSLSNLVYTNSPLNNHFEPAPNCGCLLVSLEDGKVDWKRIPLALPNLIQIDTTADKYEETLDTFNFYRISISGTPEDLRQIKSTSENVKLLKIPEVSDTYVELEVTEEVKNLSLQDALIDYMKELNFTEEKISDMIGVLHEP